MNLNINDFLSYAQTGEVPTVYSRQQAAKKTVTGATRPRPVVATMTMPAPTMKVSAPVPVVTVQPIKPALELVNYSDRSFAVFGDTKPIKDLLFDLGGKFNAYLKRNGIATPGYIFPLYRIDNVRKSLNL